MTMNKKLTMIGLIINSSVIILKEYLIIVLRHFFKLRNSSEAMFPLFTIIILYLISVLEVTKATKKLL